jgi:hypothetical protein
MDEARPTAWKRALLGIHSAAAVLPLLCLATFLLRSASVGFTADRSLYPRIENEAENMAPYLLQTWRQPRGKIIAVCGLGDAAPTAESQSIRLLQMLAEQGVVLRVISQHAGIESLLPLATQFPASLDEAARGAQALLIFDENGRYAALDFLSLASKMDGQLVFDLTGQADGMAADAAGLQLLAYGAPLGPPWLDPDLLAYAEHLRKRVPAEDGILLIMAVRPGTISGRARWFLHLNNLIFPRRMYLQDSFGASGTSVQFRQWVLDMGARGGEFPGKGQQRWEPEPRELSRVTQVGPVRTLNPEERAAVATLGVQWVSFFSLNADFRLQDWETMTVEQALEGPQTP